MAGYNHYTPLSDGSYRRSTVPDGMRRTNNARPAAPPPQQKQAPPPPSPEPKQEPDMPKKQEPAPLPQCTQTQGGESIMSFLRGLLPRQIDAADLLVISLLLLMNREEDGEGMSPLLTIALYFLL